MWRREGGPHDVGGPIRRSTPVLPSEELFPDPGGPPVLFPRPAEGSVNAHTVSGLAVPSTGPVSLLGPEAAVGFRVNTGSDLRGLGGSPHASALPQTRTRRRRVSGDGRERRRLHVLDTLPPPLVSSPSAVDSESTVRARVTPTCLPGWCWGHLPSKVPRRGRGGDRTPPCEPGPSPSSNTPTTQGSRVLRAPRNTHLFSLAIRTRESCRVPNVVQEFISINGPRFCLGQSRLSLPPPFRGRVSPGV